MMMVYLEGEQVRRAMPSGVFKTADGWLQFLVVRERSGSRSAIVLATPQLAHDPRFANGDARMRNEAELLALLRPAIAENPTAYWAERLAKADIMHERLNGFREFLAQPQTKAIDLDQLVDARRRARAHPRAQYRRHRALRRTARRAPPRRCSASTPPTSCATMGSAGGDRRAHRTQGRAWGVQCADAAFGPGMVLHVQLLLEHPKAREA